MLHKALVEYDQLSMQVEDASQSVVQSPISSACSLEAWTSQIAARTLLQLVLAAVPVATPKKEAVEPKRQLTKAVLAAVWIRVAQCSYPRPLKS
eukprot:4040339-Amphidinium_carterae.1